MTQRNKMILEIGPNIYCARYYSDIPATEQNTWWFCTADYALYEQQVLFDSLGYHSVSEICDSGNYILFAQVDVRLLEARYLSEYHAAEAKKTKLIRTSVDFRIFIDHNIEWHQWADFERAALRSEIVRWCKENGVKYQ